jgi:hypothetical protein
MLVSSRRRFLATVTGAAAGGTVPLWSRTVDASGQPGVEMLYPTQPPEIVQEMVLVAHSDFARVTELVTRQATLAKAAWDWGFGDWETALGAASHVGRRDIAEVLLAHGAHPTLFSAAMLGHLDVVKAFVAAAPGVQRTRGPHSIPLLAHAKAGGAGAKAVFDYLQTLEGADSDPTPAVTDAEIASIAGTYPFGRTPADRFEVTAPKGQLQILRPGHFPRGLIHVGGLTFYPTGAENVRVVFAPNTGGAMTLEIRDPDVVLSGTRSA